MPSSVSLTGIQSQEERSKMLSQKYNKYQEEIRQQVEEERIRKQQAKLKKDREDLEEQNRIEEEIKQLNLLARMEKGEIKPDYSQVYKVGDKSDIKSQLASKREESLKLLNKEKSEIVEQTARTNDNTHRSQEEIQRIEDYLAEVKKYEDMLVTNIRNKESMYDPLMVFTQK